MPQIQLPIFPNGVTYITPELAVQKKDEQVTYFNGHMPVFIHDEKDLQSFRMITSQFCTTGAAKQVEISKTFGTPIISVKRGVKLYREKGPGGFYEAVKTRGGKVVLTQSKLTTAQELLDGGIDLGAVAKELDVKKDTLRKALEDGRLKKKARKNPRKVSSVKNRGTHSAGKTSTKSARSVEDVEAPMGMGTTNILDRVAASIGALHSVKVQFQESLDVPNAGVLLALPALLAVGLLRHTSKHFVLPKGFYGVENIFLLLAFMALARIKTIEDLRYYAPGEWGKILGL